MKYKFALLSLIILASSILFFTTKNANLTVKNSKSQAMAQEIDQIKKLTQMKEQVGFYTKLIERVGPIEAQEQLLSSGLAFDGQTHLLNHTVGDYLFKKYGQSGLIYCKDYFLSSCYHGFVIRAVGDGGMDALVGVMETCWTQGGHVAIQCSHAIGHGFLAWIGYADLIGALKKCDAMVDKSQNFPLYNCHDGVFMENIWGVHEDGKPSPDAWLKDNDLIYPCNEPKIPYKYIKACWSNQPMRLYRLFQGDFKKAGQVCLAIKDLEHQKTCFDGLARQIHPVTNGSVDKTFELCALMPEGWIDPCIISIVKAFFSVGDRVAPYQICQRISPSAKEACYKDLVGIINAYLTKAEDKKQWCQAILEENHRLQCLN